MRIPRLYLPAALSVGESVKLTETAFRHAVQALRLKPGARLTLFNGEGGEFSAKLENIEKRRASARIETFTEREVESRLHITLVQAISKGERMDYTLQKAVELGVNRIVPVLSEYSVVNLPDERLQKRREHWQAVVISACEQSGRNRIPAVAGSLALSNWLVDDCGGECLKLLLNPVAKRSLNSLSGSAPERVTLLIGPEGGLSPDEIALAERAGFTGVALGPRILRTETAGVAALAALQILWGDFDRPAGD
jgi:16S rRNA (uracil1498-N3)-methyltransferase